jgi:hypothetical protein
MIGIDPHKGSHTAAALDETEGLLGGLRVRSGAAQLEHLVTWAAQWPERTWAIEGAGGLGYLLAQQLVSAGEHVVDLQPKLAARVRLLATSSTNKNDPNDARSVAIAALCSPEATEVRAALERKRGLSPRLRMPIHISWRRSYEVAQGARYWSRTPNPVRAATIAGTPRS